MCIKPRAAVRVYACFAIAAGSVAPLADPRLLLALCLCIDREALHIAATTAGFIFIFGGPLANLDAFIAFDALAFGLAV